MGPDRVDDTTGPSSTGFRTQVPSSHQTNGLAHGRRALSAKQERRLVEYLDEEFLQLTRNFKKRSEASSTLQNLPDYLQASRCILSFVLQIPPIDPSTSLRIAYLLHLTGDVLGAIPGYKLAGKDSTQETLHDLLDFLDDLDQSWLSVLKGQMWDPATSEGFDILSTGSPEDTRANPSPSRPTLKSSPPSQTDIARLRSLLLLGESTLEEWLTSERSTTNPASGDGTDDVSSMLERMGLLDQFDSLFTKTLDFLGGFSENAVNPGVEVVME